MATVITALVVIGILAAVVGLLVFINRRDMKKQAMNNTEANKY
ncbi:MAG: hypothetical protein ACM3VS_12345 [Candidatus Dadabacteria bacterium]